MLDGADPEIEVFAQHALLDHLRRIAVGRGDEAEVHIELLLVAETAHLPLLQNAQQLRLKVDGHLGDLVEEQGAACGGLDQTAPVAVGPGEGPAAVAEQLRLDQLLRDGGAVDADEGARRRACSGCEGPPRSIPCPSPTRPR